MVVRRRSMREWSCPDVVCANGRAATGPLRGRCGTATGPKVEECSVNVMQIEKCSVDVVQNVRYVANVVQVEESSVTLVPLKKKFRQKVVMAGWLAGWPAGCLASW